MISQDSRTKGTFGAFGQVLPATYADCETVAIKVPRHADNDTAKEHVKSPGVCVCQQALLNEVRLFRRIRHKNIVTFYGVTAFRIGEPGENLAVLGLVLEWVGGGNLKTWLQHRKEDLKSDMNEVQSVMADVARGMAFLHNLTPPIMHRDLKPGNILIQNTQPARAQVTDFGLSTIMMSSGDVLRRAGTPGFMAPEVDSAGKLSPSGCEVEDTIPYGLSADVYSYGCTCAYVVGKRTPKHLEDAVTICQGAANTPLSELAAVGQQCLQREPGRRPEFKEVVSRLAPNDPDEASTCEPASIVGSQHQNSMKDLSSSYEPAATSGTSKDLVSL